jgi:hypothetical protein
VEKNSIDFLARVIREACLRVQGNLETAVEFLPRPRRPGISLDHWLRPGPAKTDHFSPALTRTPVPRFDGHVVSIPPRLMRGLQPARISRHDLQHGISIPPRLMRGLQPRSQIRPRATNIYFNSTPPNAGTSTGATLSARTTLRNFNSTPPNAGTSTT